MLLLKYVSSNFTILTTVCLVSNSSQNLGPWKMPGEIPDQSISHDPRPGLEKNPLEVKKILETTDQPSLVRKADLARLRLTCPLRLVSLHLARSCLIKALNNRERRKLRNSPDWDYLTFLKHQADQEKEPCENKHGQWAEPGQGNWYRQFMGILNASLDATKKYMNLTQAFLGISNRMINSKKTST